MLASSKKDENEDKDAPKGFEKFFKKNKGKKDDDKETENKEAT